jgi:catechol 2,3-dioxygenase
MSEELGHVVLRVRDLERSLRFYRDTLGLRQVTLYQGRMAFPRAGEKHHDLALMEVGAAASAPPGDGVGLHHLAFKVGDSPAELRAARDRLEAAGYPVESAADHTVSQALYLHDPDGIRVELYVDADPRLWKDDPTAVASARPLVL